MNDFTKDDLEEIIESFDWIEGETSWDWKHELRNKIQSMIDSYIEFHEKCSHHELVRLRLLNQKEYDFCETCLYIRRVR